MEKKTARPGQHGQTWPIKWNRLDMDRLNMGCQPRSTAFGLRALILGFAISLCPLTAQVVNSTIVGAVTDQSGASVPNATVRVTALSTGAVQTTTTTEAGTYALTYLDPQAYSVRIEAPGFKTYTADNVVLAVSTTVRVNAVLT